jgi:hypothetical protein
LNDYPIAIHEREFDLQFSAPRFKHRHFIAASFSVYFARAHASSCDFALSPALLTALTT